MPTPQPTHTLGLNGRHADQILRIGQVGRQLGELCVQVGLGYSSCQYSISLFVSFCVRLDEGMKNIGEHTNCLDFTALPDIAAIE